MTRRLTYPVQTEVDLRQELINTFDGFFPEIAKSQIGVLRKMRRDENDELTHCACYNETTQEQDIDHFCPYCFNEKFYWDESFIEFYKVVLSKDVNNALADRQVTPGIVNEPLVIFYLKSSIEITEEDKIVELVLDEEGDPVKPYRRRKIYRVVAPLDMRSDNGRLEYWKVCCHTEHRKFLNSSEG